MDTQHSVAERRVQHRLCVLVVDTHPIKQKLPLVCWREWATGPMSSGTAKRRGRLSSSSSSLRLNRLEIQGESGSFEIHPPERSHLAVAVCYKLCSSMHRQAIQSKEISPCRLISSLAPAYSSVAARRSSALGKGGIQLMTITRDSLPSGSRKQANRSFA